LQITSGNEGNLPIVQLIVSWRRC